MILWFPTKFKKIYINFQDIIKKVIFISIKILKYDICFKILLKKYFNFHFFYDQIKKYFKELKLKFTRNKNTA